MSEWQLIHAAPRDGTRIFAWFPHSFAAYPIEWRSNMYDNKPSWTLDDGESAMQTYDPPTHWQPMPKPPVDDANNELE